MDTDNLNAAWMTAEVMSDGDLLATRYYQRIEAQQTSDPLAIDILLLVERVWLTRHLYTLCEGCLGRTGCDMCCPPDFSWMVDDFNREYEEHMMGRPLFPNEY